MTYYPQQSAGSFLNFIPNVGDKTQGQMPLIKGNNPQIISEEIKLNYAGQGDINVPRNIKMRSGYHKTTNEGDQEILYLGSHKMERSPSLERQIEKKKKIDSNNARGNYSKPVEEISIDQETNMLEDSPFTKQNPTHIPSDLQINSLKDPFQNFYFMNSGYECSIHNKRESRIKLFSTDKDSLKEAISKELEESPINDSSSMFQYDLKERIKLYTEMKKNDKKLPFSLHEDFSEIEVCHIPSKIGDYPANLDYFL